MGLIHPQYKQSNRDLSLQAFGTLDKLVKLCKVNTVLSLNTPNTTDYIYSDNDIVNSNFINYPYATRHIISIDTVIGYIAQNGFNYVSQSGENYITQQ